MIAGGCTRLPGASRPDGAQGDAAPSSWARRSLLWAAGAACMPVAPTAWAGGQAEEPLANSVRTVLSAAVANAAPPKPSFERMEDRLVYLRWLGAMSDRLQRRKSELQTRLEFLETVWYESKRAGLEPGLVLGLIQVESAFRKYAISVVGARGYMQVMPFWIKLIGSEDSNLFHLRTNLRFGCTILRHYLDIEKGNLFRALGRYNGSLGKAEYPNMVRGAWERHWSWPEMTAASNP